MLTPYKQPRAQPNMKNISSGDLFVKKNLKRLKKKLHHPRRAECRIAGRNRRQTPDADCRELRSAARARSWPRDRGRGICSAPQSPRVRHRYDDARSVFIALLVSCPRGESRTIPAVGLGPNKRDFAEEDGCTVYTQ
jgi:hypothetical protein